MANDDTSPSDPGKRSNPDPSTAEADATASSGAADTGSAPDAASATVTPISELERVTAERDKNREQLLRTAADFDNYRKRARRELEDAQKKGAHDVVRDLLPVFDNLERAVQAATSASDFNSVVEGVRMVLKLFEDTSERIGLTRIKTVGERFDPAMHEAIQQKESNDAAPGTVLSEVVPGYRFGDRLVRAAMVVVARKPSEEKKASAPPAPDNEAAKSDAAPSPSTPAASTDESPSEAEANGHEGKGA
jgi:molecular chaperone GrpE